MVPRALPTPRQRLLRQRQHGAILQQADRRDLERAGWRTTLDFRENNVRGRDGRLLQVEEIWNAASISSTPPPNRSTRCGRNCAGRPNWPTSDEPIRPLCRQVDTFCTQRLTPP
jgi:hypothetical protein